MRIIIEANECGTPGKGVVFYDMTIEVQATPMLKPLADKAAEITADFLQPYQGFTMTKESAMEAANKCRESK